MLESWDLCKIYKFELYKKWFKRSMNIIIFSKGSKSISALRVQAVLLWPLSFSFTKRARTLKNRLNLPQTTSIPPSAIDRCTERKNLSLCAASHVVVNMVFQKKNRVRRTKWMNMSVFISGRVDPKTHIAKGPQNTSVPKSSAKE